MPIFRSAPRAHALSVLPDVACSQPVSAAATRSGRGRWTFFVVALALIGSASTVAASPSTSALADLGRKIFADESLSASGRMSCATCHDPKFAHAQNNALAVQPGGANLDVPGFRAVPSLRYLNVDLPFFFAGDGTPTGGFNRDGSANTLIEQASRPFLAAHEMANGDAAGVVDKLGRASYADEFRGLFGGDVFARIDDAFLAARYALAVYEATAPELRPFSSKFDLFLKGKVKLGAQELRGFAWFNSPAKGGCAGCHPSTRASNGEPPLFTDYTYDNLGVPRNAKIPATADPDYFDFGLCGPDRSDLAARRDLCGAFKVPTLRNVATRKVVFHNGQFTSLREAIEFYVQRDTNPGKWYPLGADGAVRKFDDVPAPLARNVNTGEVPYNRRPGQAPALSELEIDDVVAFLGTLTDGYDAATDTADPARDLAQP
ncbi:MAG: cytochrome-c peroxidase [Proteobacteria bacterium]|nr:cytochrome-c peroxidase [Pseudomonadota bacterium]